MRSDEACLEAVAQGDEDALRELYARHAAGMLRLIRRLTSDRCVAEELLQESWIAVWRSAPSFRGDSSARGWMLGVARRRSHDRLRRAELPRSPIDDDVPLRDPDADVEDAVLAGAERERLVGAVQELPEHLREVLDLVLVDDLPYRDVAVALGIPTGTVKSRMSHARRRLALLLSEVPVEGAS